jgi:protein-tyrosine kinase
LNAQARGSQTQIVQPVQAYGAALTSDAVINPVLQQHPSLDRTTFLTKQLLVTSDTPSATISVQVTLPNAKMAASIANELSQAMVTQQNAVIKAQYDKLIQQQQTIISNETTQINKLQDQYTNTPATNTAQLTVLSDQLQQERAQQNTDITTLQTYQTEQSLYSTPLVLTRTATPANKPSSLTGAIPFVPAMLALFFILGAVAIAFFEQGAGRVNDTYMLQQRTASTVLGALRWEQPESLKALSMSQTPYAEECRTMMADVLFHAEEGQAHILCVTGTRPQAGTSSIAAQLAMLLAQSKRRVLLIDANMHHPTQHELLSIPNEAGLAQLLEEARKARINSPGTVGSVDIADRIPIDSYIKSTMFPTLYLLPAGTPKVNPGDLLSMPELAQFLKWSSNPVDFVVIDCPALNRGDAHVLGALSDQTLIVVDATKDRVKQVLATKNELVNTGVHLAGLVVNKLGRWI